MTAAKPDDPRKINLNLRVSQATKSALETLSLANYRSLTNQIELLIAEAMERHLAEQKAKKKSPQR